MPENPPLVDEALMAAISKALDENVLALVARIEALNDSEAAIILLESLLERAERDARYLRACLAEQQGVIPVIDYLFDPSYCKN